MLVTLDLSGVPYFEGRFDAMRGEPLFRDADPQYSRGWCAFHGITNNPYEADESRSRSLNIPAETQDGGQE